MADNTPLTGHEPKIFDDYHISETTEIFIQESSSDSRPSNLHDWEISDYTIGRALSSPPFTQEREDDASRRQAYHFPEESLLSSQSLSVGHVTTWRPVSDEFGSLITNASEIHVATQNMSKSGFFWNDKKRRFSLIIEQRFRNTSFRPIVTEEISTLAGDEQLRRDQQLLHVQLLEQNRELREAHEKSLNEMEELKRFQGSTFETIARRKLIEDRDTILELTGKIQELQNEINCMNDSRDFKDAESVRSGQSHVVSQPVFFSHLIQILVEC